MEQQTRLEKFYTRHAMRIAQASSSSSSPVALSHDAVNSEHPAPSRQRITHA